MAHAHRTLLTFAIAMLAPFFLQGVTAAVAIGLAQLALSAAAIAASILLRPKPKGVTNTGPRLEDRVVMTSSYGQPISINLGGVVRVSGGIIWAQDIREVKRKDSVSAGKGSMFGGGAGVSTITYSYFGDFAASFGEGPAAANGLLKVWCDGKIIVDNTVTGDAVKKYPDLQVRFYRGDETQLADSLIQSIEGVDNAPAYRGQCYAVFENLPLTDFGNRIPNIEVLLAYSANETKTSVVADAGATGGVTNVRYALDRNRNILYWFTNIFDSGGANPVGLRLVRYNPVTNEIEATRGPANWSDPPFGEIEIDQQGFLYVVTRENSGNPGFRILRLDPFTLDTLFESPVSTSVTGGYKPFYSVLVEKETKGAICPFIVTISIFSRIVVTLTSLNANGDITGIGDIATQDMFTLPGPLIDSVDNCRSIIADRNGHIWVLAKDVSADLYLFRLKIDTSTPTIGRLILKDTFNLTSLHGLVEARQLGYDAATHSLFIARTGGGGNSRIDRWDIKTKTIVWSLPETDPSVTVGALVTDNGSFSAFSENRSLFKYPSTGELITTTASLTATKRVYRIPIAVGKVSKIYDMTEYIPGTPQAGNGDSIYDSLTNMLYTLESITGDDMIRRISLDRVTTLTTTLQFAVEALCARGGLTVATQIDATSLASKNLRGYSIANLPSTVRSMLEPLSLAFFFDGVESDFKIKFVLRGGSVAATIIEDELGAFSDSPPNDLQRLEEDIGQDSELPEQVDVRFIDVNKDLLISDQYEKRISSPAATTFSRKKIPLDLPIVFDATEARAIVESFVFQEWTKKYGFKYQTMPKHMRLDPSDIVNVSKDGLTFGIRLVEVALGAGLVIEHVGEAEDVETYVVTGQSGDDNLHQSDQFGTVGASELFLIDYLLQDSDDPVNGLALPLYLGAAPQGEVGSLWRGATIQKSLDSGHTYNQIDVARDDSTWGRLVVTGSGGGGGATPDLAIAPYFHWETWDRTTVFRAHIVSGAARLVSVAESVLLENLETNALMVGQELIRFATVVDNADGTFDFSVLLRGRRGTGWAAEAGHRGGTTIQLLDSGAMSYNSQLPAERDIVRHWRAVTLAGILDNAATRAAAITGLGLKPYRVSHVESVRDGSNNLVLTWIRESRVGGELNWEDGVVDIPVGEASESYTVEYVAPNHRGASTGITATTLTQAAAGWTVNAFTGFHVIHRHNPLIGVADTTRGEIHLRRILSNTATILTLESNAWAFTPTIGDSFFIVNLAAPTIERTEVVATETATYSAAEQTADGVTLGNGVLAIIYQSSAAIGKGVPRHEPMFGT